MNVLDFDFVRPATAVAKSSAVRSRYAKPVPAVRDREGSPLTVNEGERFLRIVAQTSRIRRHYELLQFLQGEDIQHYLPHQILVSAWGDLSEPSLKLDVVSAIPGVRTGLLNRCASDAFVTEIYRRWLANGRMPLLMDSSADIKRALIACDCAFHRFLQGDWYMLAHAVTDVRDGSNSLYLAFNKDPIFNGTSSPDRFSMLADPLVAQIDVAFRRIAALKTAQAPVAGHSVETPVFSTREVQILVCMSEGKTNSEIAAFLGISSYTVKNHVQRIFRKLDAGNRTEAVGKARMVGGLG